MKRKTVLLTAAFLAVLFATACGARGPTEGARAAGRIEVVRMDDFIFAPSVLEIDAGRVRFDFRNDGTVEHNFIIEGTGKGTPPVPPGQKFELEVNLKPGSYKVYCDVPGHTEAGMVMTLIVK